MQLKSKPRRYPVRKGNSDALIGHVLERQALPISFQDAVAYAEECDRRDGQVQSYTASPERSVCDRNVWNLLSEGDEWLAEVWVDRDAVYHIARDMDSRTLQPIERL